MDDGFIRSHIGDLLRSLRTQYLIDLIKPYTRLELSFLAKVCDSTQLKWTTNYSCPMKQLNVDANEVEELLIDLILESKIDGKIDQVNMRLELDKQYVFPCSCASVPSNFSTAKASRGGDTQPSINGLGHSVEFMEPSWGNHRQATVETHQRPDAYHWSLDPYHV
jgi:hypothetical protein